MQLQQRRRSFLATLAAMGVLFGGSTATATGSETRDGDERTLSSDPTLVGVEVIDEETGDRSRFDDSTELRRADLDPGEYLAVEVYDVDGAIVERTDRLSVDDASVETLEDEIDVRLTVEDEPVNGHFGPNGTVPVWAGAVERTDGIDVPVEGVSLDISLVDPDGEPVETVTEETNEDGNIYVEFELDGADFGGYEVEVVSEETDSTDTESVNVGPYTEIHSHDTAMPPGEVSRIGVYSSLDGVPEADVSREIRIEKPDGSEELVDVEFDDGGIGFLEITPEDHGEYGIEGVETQEWGRDVAAAEYVAISTFAVEGHYAGETVRWGAHVVDFDEKEPVSDLDVSLTVSEGFGLDPETVYETSESTNEFGQFTVEFDAPEDAQNLRIELETNDEEPIHLDNDWLFIDERTDPDPDPIDFDVDIDTFGIPPGGEAPIEVSLAEEGDSISDATVTLLFHYSWHDVPAGAAEVTTDADGKASYKFELDDTAPDGENVYATGIVELDGEKYFADDFTSIERYDVSYSAFNLVPGETNELVFEITDDIEGEPASGIDVTVFGERDYARTETFDADHARTDADGETTLEVDIPEDVRYDIAISRVKPNRDMFGGPGSIEDPFDVDVDVSPSEPAPGETVTIEYSTDHDEPVGALVASIPQPPAYEGPDVALAREDEPVELDVPEELDPGSFQEVVFVLIGDDGAALRWFEFVSIAEELSASFYASPAEPSVGETVTFEDTSTPGPDAEIDEREWDLTGDGEVDETGEKVTWTFDESGDHDVELTVTDEEGITDSATETITIEDQPSVGDYADDGTGTVETDGLREAIDDWRGGEIDTDLLREVIDAWRSGDPIEE